MNRLSVEVSDSQKAFLEAQAAKEGLRSPSDYVQELIRAAERQKAWALLEKEIQRGLDSGDAVPITDASWAEKRARFLQKHPEAGTP
jgi:Arc/MetJ-type ribon-helix-helix transcriptional regulator